MPIFTVISMGIADSAGVMSTSAELGCGAVWCWWTVVGSSARIARGSRGFLFARFFAVALPVFFFLHRSSCRQHEHMPDGAVVCTGTQEEKTPTEEDNYFYYSCCS
jgi:hypothetical protein